MLADTLDTKSLTLEHILPENFPHWRDVMWTDIQHNPRLKDALSKAARASTKIALLSEYHSRLCYCIGNLALLTPDRNSSVSDFSFPNKLKVYKRYERDNWLFAHNKCVLGQSQWGEREIRARADLLARTFEKVIQKLC